MKYWCRTIEGVEILDIDIEGLMGGDYIWKEGDKYTTNVPEGFRRNVGLKDAKVFIGDVEDKGALTWDFSKVPISDMFYGWVLQEV
jgi:hypothetical protein